MPHCHQFKLYPAVHSDPTRVALMIGGLFGFFVLGPAVAILAIAAAPNEVPLLLGSFLALCAVAFVAGLFVKGDGSLKCQNCHAVIPSP